MSLATRFEKPGNNNKPTATEHTTEHSPEALGKLSHKAPIQFVSLLMNHCISNVKPCKIFRILESTGCSLDQNIHTSFFHSYGCFERVLPVFVLFLTVPAFWTCLLDILSLNLPSFAIFYITMERVGWLSPCLCVKNHTWTKTAAATLTYQVD